MNVNIGFRCPGLLFNEVKNFQSKNKLNKTDAYIRLFELGIKAESSSNEEELNAMKNQINALTRISIQCLCIVNQLGELAGEETVRNAEEEYTSLVEQLGVQS